MKKLIRSFLFAFGLAVVGAAQAAPAALVAGKDYTVMKTPQQADVPAGKVEVIEFFWYGCPHCNEFEPYLESWIKKQGPDVVFKRVPVAFRPDFVPHTKLYYALKALGVEDKLTPTVFNEIHKNKDYLLTPEAQADFLAKQGVDKQKFLNAYNSFTTTSETNRAAELVKKYDIDGVPTLVVQGKYVTGPAQTNSLPGTLTVLDELVAQVRAKKM